MIDLAKGVTDRLAAITTLVSGYRACTAQDTEHLCAWESRKINNIFLKGENIEKSDIASMIEAMIASDHPKPATSLSVAHFWPTRP